MKDQENSNLPKLTVVTPAYMSLESLLEEYKKENGNLITIILPVFNEIECLPFVVPEIINYLNTQQQKYFWQLIFVDDCSTDNSYQYLSKIAETVYDKVKIITFKLSKNSGSHIAISAGLKFSNGDFTIIMASDGQDPVEVIGELISQWENKFDFVIAARKNNLDHNELNLWLSNTAWKLMNWFTKINMPQGGCDMLGIDKKVLFAFNKMDERNTTFIYRLLSLGFDQKVLYYSKKERIAGKSKWTLIKKIKIIIDVITSHSSRPLRLITKFSLIITFILLLRWLFVIINVFILGGKVTDLEVILNTIFTTTAFIMMTLSAIGDYIWRILDEARKRPQFEISKIAGNIQKKET